MNAFPDWEKYIVPQRRTSGCIPTGFEIILRASHVEGIDFNSFQDEFDLDQSIDFGMVQPRNNFVSIADAIKHKYPFVDIDIKVFNKGEGVEKVKFIEQMISQQRPILISLSLQPFGQGGWHIMVVVDSTEDEFCLLNRMTIDGKIETIFIRKVDLVTVHEKYEGGNDVAYLSR